MGELAASFGTDLLGAGSGAELSLCRTYRYVLWRVWDIEKPPLVFVLLNPSTADEIEGDPTISRCMRRAIALGCGSLWVVNLFAYRSTKRAVLKTLPDPVGPKNDEFILSAARKAGQVVCGWGNDGKLLGRDQAVLGMLRSNGVKTMALAVNDDGTPGHPLYLPYTLRPVEFA